MIIKNNILDISREIINTFIGIVIRFCIAHTIFFLFICDCADDFKIRNIWIYYIEIYTTFNVFFQMYRGRIPDMLELNRHSEKYAREKLIIYMTIYWWSYVSFNYVLYDQMETNDHVWILENFPIYFWKLLNNLVTTMIKIIISLIRWLVLT